ncbi:codanin-1 isoform X1 [Macrobrachium rosenbergii]|uniref:codanin-1 isoform X1 n=2 Tax=Macrobrachium rosenbergii TaxID=79674 RepID=UPI0034D3E546
MSTVLELLLGGQVVPQMLIEWLDGLPVKGILGDVSSQRIEFIPVFLNFLRDQSSSILQIGLTGGLTPNKCSSLVRAIKYVSPGKDPGMRSRARKHYTSARAKTLKFLESPDKNGKLGEGTSVPDVGQLLREAEYPLTVNRGAVTSCLNKNLYCSTPKGTGDRTKSPNQQGYASPKLTSPDYPSGERNAWAKRQSQETSDRGGRGNFNSEKRHSEQRLSLGDFLQSDTKKGIKKRSPLPRDNSARNNTSGMVRQTSRTLDITDENAFPVVGCVPQQEKQPKRRINPTRITPVSASRSNKSNPFGQNSKNMFGFPQGQSPSTSFNSVSEEGSKTLEEEREMLRQERLKWQEVASKDNNLKSSGRDTPPNLALQKLNGKPSEFKEATLAQVTKKAVLDVIAQVYADLILCNMVPSIMVELYYVIQLLTVRVLDSEESDSDEDSESYLGNLHNCVYFSTKVLSHLLELIKLLDRTTITLLSENPRIQCFCTDLEKQLMKFLENPPPEPLLSQQPKSPIGGVSFQSDTDNRQNFSCDQAFHVFRKQRDSFYEIIRIWEENHLTPGWSFSQSLGPRIRHLLAMRVDPTNYAHFARLFQLQLLTMCRGEDVQFDPNQDPEDLGFLALLKKQHPEKYKRLHERLVTPSKLGGPCPAPSFPGSQEFFKDFIIIAAHGAFNQFLKDVLISHILRLNEQDFIVVEQDERDPVESMVHMEARSVVLNLRLLAKFLGFVEFLPYQTTNHLSENVIATHIDLRSKVCPPLNLNVALRQCAAYGRLVVGVTWIVEYLSMVDPVALHSKHYLTVVMTLIAIFKILYITSIEIDTGCPQCMKVSHSKNLAPSNSLLLKFLLGWLFDLPAFPDGLFFADIAEADIDHCEYNQNLKTIQANYSHFCVLCLRQMLSTEYKEKCMEAKLPVYGICTPSKNKVVKGKSLANTPVKQIEKDVVMSPMKTPSKYMAMSLLDTPDTTPLKPSDSQDSTELIVCLDISHFVDQQLITICCPFVCELKNLLNDFLLGTGSSKNTGSNSCRRITPLSASEKETPGKAQIDIQLQLEENFFHNHPSSFRKTTDFVIERVSSNIIRNIRLVVIPQLRESATDKLRATVDNQVQNSPVLGDCRKDSVKKQVNELSTEMCAQLKTHCLQLPQQEIQEQVNTVLSLLLPSDITPQEVEVCQKLVVRSTMEKVNAWTQSHLTPSQFCKELTLDSERLIRQAQKTADLLAIAGQGSQDDTTLSLLESSDVSAFGGETNASGYQSSLSFSDTPVSPSNQPHLPRPVAKKPSALESLPVTAKEHDPDVMPPSYLLKLLKAMVYKLISSVNVELNKVDFASDVQNLIHNIQQVVSKREDVTLTVFRALEALTVDLAVALACCLPFVMTSEIQKAFVSLWRPVEEDGLIPSPCGLSSLMCPRTVMLIAQNPSSKHQDAAWKKMEEFISLLVSSNLISPVSLQEQCVSLLRHSWPEGVLAGLSSCIKGISKNCNRQNFADDSTFTELLEWVGWVCGEMEEFPDLI